ncbi:MAG: 16S rRNA (guanine(966)-N(2))-methyltransferase RsmD [Cyanobacteria bacterium RUI128]|nr:16S rRNA (guanine(966)-N(2))-methyltransferase RsmD [Cyanobacteria bacterium RUI128]
MNITGGTYNGRKIKAPDEKLVRPTLSKIRMSVFNTLYSLMESFEGKSFLDMFGGSGVMGLEAISRGFKRVVVFEKNKQVSEIIKSNYSQLGLTPELLVGDSLKLIEKQKDTFDVIYIDPPYMSDSYKKFIETPFIKSKDTIVIFEHVTELEFTGYEIIKQKKYGDKYLTFCRADIKE